MRSNYGLVILWVLMGSASASEPLYHDFVYHDFDGMTIKGKLKATNAWLRIGVKGRIQFDSGYFSWTTKADEQNSQRAPYQVTQLHELLIFTTEYPLEPGSQDIIQWQGTHDGERWISIKAVWDRTDKDFVHDLMLPEVVFFEFKPILDKATVAE